jgi:hypothetical protein
MVAVGPFVRYAIKLSPVALEVARQVDRQLRPRVLAYRRAREVDGFVGRWTAASATHWLVFPRRDAEPVVAFPPLREEELDLAHGEIARDTLRHHAELPEARAGERARSLAQAPRRAAGRVTRRGGR